MSPEQDRHWPWFQQAVDAVVAVVGIATAATMLVRDSYPYLGVLFALICLGKISATPAVKLLMNRWDK